MFCSIIKNYYQIIKTTINNQKSRNSQDLNQINMENSQEVTGIMGIESLVIDSQAVRDGNFS